ncbi:trypsin-like peptidase domain-containing protein [Streptomyces sp. A7024]|uniref:Trypsin-like peptidase domain-containing protein n=1 Tax=Streptomyces coryli TaxID=1128680 RepID=A0A6G4TYQ3_9ACTN|nr:serine protease [Streptomyces coryli]NGN64157.1 trypsin-like peptidase domain-containing protein [Streptomyces coryli]
MKKPLVGAFAASLLLIGAGAAPALADNRGETGPEAAGFAGTVALSNCSGSVIRVPDSQPTDPALVMSNGHCLEGGMPGPGEVVVDQPSGRTFDLLDASGNEVGVVKASKVAYGTMTDTDVSLYELTSSYQQIESDYGIKPLELSADHPAQGSAITVVSGYWKQTYSCAIDGFAHQLREADWTWKDSVRYTSACKTIGGTSGSPVVDDATGKVVAVNNTLNEDGQECTLNNPCEVDENGTVTVHHGIGYGQQTYTVVPCVGAGNKIDLNAAGCSLPKPAGAQATS